VDTIVTAKSISFANMGVFVGVVKLASMAAMPLVLVIVSFLNDSFTNDVRFIAYKKSH